MYKQFLIVMGLLIDTAWLRNVEEVSPKGVEWTGSINITDS